MKNKTHKVICLSLTIILAIGCCTVMSYAGSKTVSSKFYTQCIKDGNTVYCYAGDGIYKVNIKKKSKKRIYKQESAIFEHIRGMKLKKGYLYCSYASLEDEAGLFRIKTSGKSLKWLVHFDEGVDKIHYATEGKKAYCYAKYYNENDKLKTYKKKMNLDGSKKKNTKTIAKTKYVKSNKKGYKVIEKDVSKGDDEIIKYYLKTPSKTIYLSTVNYEED